MQLYAFFRHQIANPAYRIFRRRQSLFANRTVLLQHRCRIDQCGTRLFDFQRHIGHAMLQGLKAADQHTELLARAQVFERCFFRRIHRTDGFSAQCDDAATQTPFNQTMTLAGNAKQCRRR